MGKSRTCGPKCHNATQPECDCWCAGLFHGESGKAAREAFAEAFGEAPNDIQEDSLFWNRAITAATNAHTRQATEDLARRNALNVAGPRKGTP